MVVGPKRERTHESFGTTFLRSSSLSVESVYRTPGAVTVNLRSLTTKLRTESDASTPFHCHLDENMRCDNVCRSLSYPQEPLSYSLADRVSARGRARERTVRSAAPPWQPLTTAALNAHPHHHPLAVS